ncbi:uncharacterized protein [Branchiostoma lanceolatum]|uniref:uncharacterized protein n=1 Tax=Branchiostoma lanceolatum TaxID=7740 RepID=UPI0034541835
MSDEIHPSSTRAMMKSIMSEAEIYKGALQSCAKLKVVRQEIHNQLNLKTANDAVKRLTDEISETEAENAKHLDEMRKMKEEMRRIKEESQAAIRRKEEAMRRKEEENQAALRRKEEENQAILRRKEEENQVEIEALNKKEAESQAALEVANKKIEMDEATLKVKEASINVKDQMLVETAAALKESNMDRSTAIAVMAWKGSWKRIKNERDQIAEELRKRESTFRKLDKHLQKTLKELYDLRIVCEGVDRIAPSLRGLNP